MKILLVEDDREISRKLSDIVENDSDEKVMVFTDNRALMELCGQMNRLLLDRQKIKRDFRKQELSSKKCFPTYPIRRKKLFLAQMLTVWSFNFKVLVSAQILICAALTVVKKYTYIRADSIALGNNMFYIFYSNFIPDVLQ